MATKANKSGVKRMCKLVGATEREIFDDEVLDLGGYVVDPDKLLELRKVQFLLMNEYDELKGKTVYDALKEIYGDEVMALYHKFNGPLPSRED